MLVRDLTDPSQGPHALQRLVDDAVACLVDVWACDVVIHRADPIVSVADNYDHLGYAPDAAARNARYTRYLGDGRMLRSHTSAMLPPLLRGLAREDHPPVNVLLACPGTVYRRDEIGRQHSGTPQQIDLWRLRTADLAMAPPDLHDMVAALIGALLPGHQHRTIPAVHPYTRKGCQVDVRAQSRWTEVGECGLVHPEVLARAGLDPARTSGLALGLGLDRILMIRKDIPDIRLLRSADPRVAVQMLDLEPWRPVSSYPAVRRDVSVAVAADDTAEDLGDRVRDALGRDADAVEEVEVVSETPADRLPSAASARLGIGPDQKNVLVKVVLRHLERTLTAADANDLRDRIYAALHRPEAVPARTSRR